VTHGRTETHFVCQKSKQKTTEIPRAQGSPSSPSSPSSPQRAAPSKKRGKAKKGSKAAAKAKAKAKARARDKAKAKDKASASAAESGRQTKARKLKHLDLFFRKYPEYDAIRDRDTSVASQFDGLKRHLLDPVLKRYNLALVLQFNETYGVDVNDINDWRRVFETMGVKPPKTASKCKSVSYPSGSFMLKRRVDYYDFVIVDKIHSCQPYRSGGSG
jgi:hypothetical protein